MKIRNGFVSNSSSSSFIALGFSIKDSHLPFRDLVIALGHPEKEVDNLIEECRRDGEEEMDEHMVKDALWDVLYNFGKEAHIRILAGGEDGVGEDDEVITLILAETDSYDGGYFGQGEITLNDSDADYSKIKKIRDRISPDAEIRVLYGTRCC